jgi:hypothetical protein
VTSEQYSVCTAKTKPGHEMRSTEAQLLEAELMNSTPEHVYGWLKNRAEQSDEESYSGDEELEGALLSRGSALIDLGLARHGCSAAVVR